MLVFYVVSAFFGLIAVIFTDRMLLGERLIKTFVMLAAVSVICIADYLLLVKNKLSFGNPDNTEGIDSDAQASDVSDTDTERADNDGADIEKSDKPEDQNDVQIH